MGLIFRQRLTVSPITVNDFESAVAYMEGIQIYPLVSEQTAKIMEFRDTSRVKANLLQAARTAYIGMLDHFIQSKVVDPSDHGFAVWRRRSAW